MTGFESLLGVLLIAVLLAAVARRMGAPYPAFLALGGAVLAFVPGAPRFSIDPEVALALFVAPVLLDAAYDASPRDLKDNWVAVGSLAIVSVALTTVAVAWVARALVPAMPWAAAIALGAIVSPPDAAAATAVLRQLRPPHRILMILEGESLLNDASALLIYRLAVGAVALHAFSVGSLAPTLGLVLVGSLLLGLALSRVMLWLTRAICDVPTAIIVQFVGTFGVWILADRLGFSAVLTMVTFAIAVARRAPASTPARMRDPDLCGLGVRGLRSQRSGVRVHRAADPPDSRKPGPGRADALHLRRGSGPLDRHPRADRVGDAPQLGRAVAHPPGRLPSAAADVAAHRRQRPRHLVVGHARHRLARRGARAVVRPGAGSFPYRDLIVLTAFAVVLGTLVIQGLTLRPLIRALNLHDDDPVGREVEAAREKALDAALSALSGDTSAVADVVRLQIEVRRSRPAGPAAVDTRDFTHGEIQRRALEAARRVLFDMRARNDIGDHAFHRLEEEFDWVEMGIGDRGE